MVPALPDDLHLESLDVGAAPLVRHFLQRLDLHGLFQRHLPVLPGRRPQLATATVLEILLTNLLLARQPLYALPHWAARRVPACLGLLPGQADALNDDRLGRALDHLHRADRASLLVALTRQAVAEFHLDLSEFHQDTTTVTFSGAYADQPPVPRADRPPRITFGYNKDHRPDLKQLLFSITLCDDGAVPLHGKLYDGNTTDDAVHRDTWAFLRQLVGHSDFLYVADSKLCSRDNLSFIAAQDGRFLTVMPRTRGEDSRFRAGIDTQTLDWQEVHREPHPRRQGGPDVVYLGVESPQRSAEGYRLLWYRSSQKAEQDRQQRQQRLRRAHSRLADLQGGRRRLVTPEQARQLGERVVAEEQVADWLQVVVTPEMEEEYRQSGRGRPGPETEYRRVEHWRYRVTLEEDGAALRREGLCDGLFPLLTNDEALTLATALQQYKYQPFVEKRHEQLKSVFGVTPVWLKNVARVESLLWLYFVVELVAALIERELRQQLVAVDWPSLALYPEGRASVAPTAGLVFSVLEGHRRHRLLDGQGRELRRFDDPLSPAAQDALALLGVDGAAYGID